MKLHMISMTLTYCALGLVLASRAANADTFECVINPGVSQEVNDEATGASLGIVEAGDRIYSRWGAQPFAIFVIKNDQFRQIEGLRETMYDCGGASSRLYPIVFEGLRGRAQLFKEFGLVLSPTAENPSRDQLPRAPHKCFYIGDGLIEMELTEEVYSAYRAKGLTLRQICMVLRSGQVRFHPETGQRLPTYVTIDDPGKNAAISDEYLFQIPECFARGKVRMEQFGASMKPLGCQVNFHPWSGRKLSPAEVAFFTKQTTLHVSGDAGDVKEDSDNLASDSNRQATSARIRAVKDLLKK